jgi:Tfp pilus assembly protein PilW
MSRLMLNRRRRTGGFTLVELAVWACIHSAVMSALVFGSIALQRSFSASQAYADEQNDQLRVIDYVTRDLRRASTVAVSNSGTKLTVTVPDQIDPNTLNLRTPVISANGIVSYGSTPVTIAYFIEGSSFIREENGVDTVISTTIDDFQVSQNQASVVQFTLGFTPGYSLQKSADARQASHLSASVFLRNAN